MSSIEIDAELELESAPSEWKLMKGIIEKRPRGWLTRFGKKLTPEMIEPEKKDYWDRRWDKMTSSGWKNIAYRPTPPSVESFPDLKNQQVQRFEWGNQRTIYCCFCGQSVPIGSRGNSCKVCNLVCHRACCLKQKATTPPPYSDLGIQSKLSNANRDNWICPFCVDEMTSYQSTQRQKYASVQSDYKRNVAAIKLQSFIRMLIFRLPFLRCRDGITRFQQIVRAVQYGKRLSLERINHLRPFRIRIHSLFTVQSVHSGQDIPIDPGFPFNLVDLIKLGEMKSSVYDQHFGPEFLPYQAGSDSNAGPVNKMMDILRVGHQFQPMYLHTAISQAAASSAVATALSTPLLKSFPKGKMILTITIHAIESHSEEAEIRKQHAAPYKPTISSPTNGFVNGNDDFGKKPPQIYRFDTPLRDDSYEIPWDEYIKRTGLSIASLTAALPSSLLEAHGGASSFNLIAYLKARYRLNCWSFPRPYLLIPAVKANIQIRFSLSEVTDWPRCTLLGQGKHRNISVNLMWRKSTSFWSSFHSCNWFDVPDTEEGCKVQLIYRSSASSNPFSTSVPSSNGNMTTTATTTGTSVAPSTPHHAPSTPHHSYSDKTSAELAREQAMSSSSPLSHHSRRVVHASLVWSLLSFSEEDENQSGFLHCYPEMVVNGPSKRYWAVLQDRTLMLFPPNVRHSAPSVQLDLKNCSITPMEHGFIRIKEYVGDFWFLRPKDLNELPTWFKKLYSQCLSNQKRAYLPFMKRLLQKSKFDVSCFIDEKNRFLIEDVEVSNDVDDNDSLESESVMSLSQDRGGPLFTRQSSTRRMTTISVEEDNKNLNNTHRRSTLVRQPSLKNNNNNNNNGRRGSNSSVSSKSEQSSSLTVHHFGTNSNSSSSSSSSSNHSVSRPSTSSSTRQITPRANANANATVTTTSLVTSSRMESTTSGAADSNSNSNSNSNTSAVQNRTRTPSKSIPAHGRKRMDILNALATAVMYTAPVA